MKLTRHQIREVALQSLFAVNGNPDVDGMTIVSHLLEEKHVSECPEYLCQLVNGVLEHQGELDRLISSKLDPSWSLNRLNKIDLVILRLGLFEMKYCTGTPNKVALNEALQLAKDYGDEKERKFINGVLSNFI